MATEAACATAPESVAGGRLPHPEKSGSGAKQQYSTVLQWKKLWSACPPNQCGRKAQNGGACVAQYKPAIW